MTTNGQIALAVLVLSLTMIELGCVLIWRNRHNLWEWPVCAGVAMAGTYIAPGLVLLQVLTFRVFDLPWPFGVNDFGTLGFRVLAAITLVAFSIRAHCGRIITDDDRKRGTLSRIAGRV